MNLILDEHSLYSIVATRWIPPLITVVIGGYLASILFPKWQERITRARLREDRRFDVAEKLSKSLTRYVAAWSRLRTIAELEVSRELGLSEMEKARKAEYIAGRQRAKDELIDALAVLSLYFPKRVRIAGDDFLRWDDACSSLRLADLPPREEFDRKREILMSEIHKDIL